MDNDGRVKLSKGQLHYHIMIDIYVDWNEVKEKWNYLQEKAGYLDEFKEKYNHTNPNSTDVHKMYEINDLSAYLLKYITKEMTKEDNESDEDFASRMSVGGKVWDCSKKLKGRKLYTTNFSSSIEKNLKYLEDTDRIKRVNNDYCTIYLFNQIKPTIILNQEKRHEYYKLLEDIIEDRPLPKKKFINMYELTIKKLVKERYLRRYLPIVDSSKIRTKLRRKYNRKLELISLNNNTIQYG
jgi:hypothetical protein